MTRRLPAPSHLLDSEPMVITQGEVIRQNLRPLTLAADPHPLAPARVHQEAFAWSSA